MPLPLPLLDDDDGEMESEQQQQKSRGLAVQQQLLEFLLLSLLLLLWPRTTTARICGKIKAEQGRAKQSRAALLCIETRQKCCFFFFTFSHAGQTPPSE